MTYENFQDIIEDVKKNNSFCCSVSNFIGLCNLIEKALKVADLETAIDEMHRLTHLYAYATSVKEYKWARDGEEFNLADYKTAKTEIETYFCNNFVTGKFEITEDILNRHWDMVDWDGYYNQTNRRFIDACKKANQIIGYTGDEESTKHYTEDKERFGFEEIFYSHYNGGRLRASFRNEDDALLWGFHGDAHLEDDGLYWAEQPAY